MYKSAYYSISVQREITPDGRYFVARVREFPDVREYAGTPEKAYALARDTIDTSLKMLGKAPEPYGEYDPRVERLRMQLQKIVTIVRTANLNLCTKDAENALKESISI